MKNLLITCDNEQEFEAVREKFNGNTAWNWNTGVDVIKVRDGRMTDADNKEYYNNRNSHNDYKRITAKEIINSTKPKKTMSKKTYKTKVEVEKTIKFSLPKYEVGKPVHVDMAERLGSERPVRATILPILAVWDFDVNENIYKYIDGGEERIAESYINKHLIKA